MNHFFRVRRKYGNTFVTVFSDNLLIPWKPLSLQDYIQYSLDKDRGVIPISQLEDEIFKKCVQNKVIIDTMGTLRAGIITTVVDNIWQYSGPQDVDSFNQDLESARSLLLNTATKVLHELVQIITVAFPYKPEEVYSMDYQTFMFRLAQAEKKLLDMGLYLKEPIALTLPDKERKLGTIPENKVNAKELWDSLHKQPKETSKPILDQKDKWWKISPVLESENKVKIDFKKEEAEQMTFGLSGHEQDESLLLRQQLVQDAQWIYKDLINELNKKE